MFIFSAAISDIVQLNISLVRKKRHEEMLNDLCKPIEVRDQCFQMGRNGRSTLAVNRLNWKDCKRDLPGIQKAARIRRGESG